MDGWDSFIFLGYVFGELGCGVLGLVVSAFHAGRL